MINELGVTYGAKLPPVFLLRLKGRPRLRCSDRCADGWQIGFRHGLFVREISSSDKVFLGAVYVDIAVRSYYSCRLGELVFS